MSPARKWQLIEQSRRLARMLHDAGLRERRPDATDADLNRSWLRATLGAANPAIPPPGTEPMVPPKEQLGTVRDVIAACDRRGIAYALGGSLASSIYGNPRYTLDADMTVEPFPGRELEFCRQFGAADFVSPDAATEANRRHSSFNVINTEAGFKVDLFIRRDRDFERSLMARRRMLALGGSDEPSTAVVSPEDVILLKLEEYRLGGETSERPWRDVLPVVRVQADRLDGAYLDRRAADLGVLDLLERIRAEAGDS